MQKLENYLNAEKATEDLPYGNLKDETQADANDGTPIVASQIQDIMYSLYQVLQLAGELPNGELEDGNTKKQFIQSLCKIGLFKYSSSAAYSLGNIVLFYDNGTVSVYRSMVNKNTLPLSDAAAWKLLLTIDNNNKINFYTDTNIDGGSGRNFPVFCFNSGPVDEKGESALMSLENGILTQHSPAVLTTANGETYTVNQDVSLDISNLEGDKYNIFYNADTGGLEVYDNKVYIQKFVPVDWSVNDIWINISVLPYRCYQKKSNTEFQIVRLVQNASIVGKLGGGGNLTAFNYNYFADIIIGLNGKANVDLANVTAPSQSFKDLSISFIMPDYSRMVSKNAGTASKPNITDTDCYILFKGSSTVSNGSGGSIYAFINNKWQLYSGAYGVGLNDLHYGSMIILPKGISYYMVCAIFEFCYEIPLRGVQNA